MSDDTATPCARIAKAGRLLCVDSGAYSDYSVTGFFVVLRDFDPLAELQEFEAKPKAEEDEWRGFNEHAFLASLLAKGLLLEVEYGTLYLGQYSSSDAFRFTP